MIGFARDGAPYAGVVYRPIEGSWAYGCADVVLREGYFRRRQPPAPKPTSTAATNSTTNEAHSGGKLLVSNGAKRCREIYIVIIMLEMCVFILKTIFQ